MKDLEHRTITTILKKWYQGTIEMLAIFPLLMTIGVFIIPEQLWVWIVSLLVFHGLGLILGRRLFNKPRYTQFGVG
ncbi:MAG TPA: hypothetical protein VFD57_06710, partial [Clostridia bacterium]|nr:hypothetical protein [Clostridia bacterium]